MKVYATENIRNVVLLGHGGCGKTSLIESMAFSTGIIKRVRTVAEGGTVSDYDKEEIKRKFSIQASVIPLEVDGVKVNIIDTPGLFDFAGEVYEALSVADAAVIVINGKSGIQVGTRSCNPDNFPLHKPFGKFRILDLLTDGNLVTMLDESVQISVHCVIGNSAHGSPLIQSAFFAGQGDLQLT